MSGPNIDELLKKILDKLDLNNNTNVSTASNPMHAPIVPVATPIGSPVAFHMSGSLKNSHGPVYYVPPAQPVPPYVPAQPDFASDAWNIDTSASFHLNNSVNSLSEIFNTCMYPSISFGDGHHIPVTNTCHSILPTPTKSLHLNNVFITPHIVKNLISIRQFVCDNNCTIEFDEFGFFVKDFLTCRCFLRSDSTGDLYPVATPSLIPYAFLLGKHVRLPFVSFSTVISSCFDIIHSDVWTSPIPSLLDDTFDLQPTIPNPTLTIPTIGQTDPLPHQQHPTEPAAQQSPTAASPTLASPSSAQIHSPFQQPSPIDQHTPVQLQFSYTAVSHQTIIVSDQHAPAIIQNLPVNPNPDSVHPIFTRFGVGTNRPTERLNLLVSLVSPLQKSYRDAFNDPNWQNAMRPAVASNWAVCYTLNPPVLPRSSYSTLSGKSSGQGTDTAYLLLYVDDIVLASSSESLLQQIIGSLHKEFAMTDLGSLNYFLGISVTCDSSGLFLSQKKYASEILERSNMVNCNPSRTPVDIESKLGADGDPISDLTLYRSLAGSLQILRYVQGTLDYGLQLFSTYTTELVAYSDADWAGCPTTQRSTSGRSIVVLPMLLLRLVGYAIYYVRVLHVPSRYQFADIFTKGLSSALFENFRSSLSVRCPPTQTAGEC
nr:ribonuclease H-like domain-containing protein [Tanacetum cinerariifolium]